MNRLERKAALAVAAATAGVIVSGVSLLRKHTRYLTEKAAATFGNEENGEMDELTREALAAGGEGPGQETQPGSGEASGQEQVQVQAQDTAAEGFEKSRESADLPAAAGKEEKEEEAE